MPTVISIRSDGTRRAIDVQPGGGGTAAPTLIARGYVPDFGNYRSFESNGDYYTGYTDPDDSTTLQIKRIQSGVADYFSGVLADWASRTTLTYEEFGDVYG